MSTEPTGTLSTFIAESQKRTGLKLQPIIDQVDRLDHILADLQNHMDRVFTNLGLGKPSKPSKIRTIEELQMLQVNRHNENRTQIENLQATVNQLTEAVAELDQPKKPGYMEATTNSNLAAIDAELTRLQEHETAIHALREHLDQVGESLNMHRKHEHQKLDADIADLDERLRKHLTDTQA